MQRFVRQHYFFIGLCLAFLVCTFWTSLRWYSHQLNPDAMAYFSIAQKYAHGDIRHAINGYWSPLLSWLLVPAVWLHLNLIVAAKWLNALIAVALLGVVYVHLVRSRVDRVIIYATCFILATLFSIWVVYEAVTPDLIEALLVVLVALCLNRFMRSPSRKTAYVLGLLGTGMYFAKGVGFYLFLIIVILAAAWEWWSSRPKYLKPTAARYAPVLAVFLAITLPFILVISLKYHRPTINNAGTFDWNVYGIQGQSIQPIDTLGPVAPPNPSAVSAWEDPTFLASRTPNWNPLQSRAALDYFGKLLWQNINNLIGIMQGFGAYISFAFVVLIIACLRRSPYQRECIIYGSITLLSILAYIGIFIDARYLWGEVVFAIIATALYLSTLLKAKVVSRLQLIVAACVIGSFMALASVQAVVGSRHAGQDEYDAGLTLASILPPGSHVISDQFPETFPICYQLQLHCYGVLAPGTQTTAYDQLLQKFGVTYYLDFHTRDNDQNLQAFLASHALFMQDLHTDDLHYTLYRLD